MQLQLEMMGELFQQVDGMEGQPHPREVICQSLVYYSLHLYSSKKGKALASLCYLTKNIAALDFSCSSNDETNNIIACGSRDGRISLWNLYQHVQ